LIALALSLGAQSAAAQVQPDAGSLLSATEQGSAERVNDFETVAFGL
jgi:hypothetical protein